MNFQLSAVPTFGYQTIEPRLHPADPVQRAINRAWTDFLPTFSDMVTGQAYSEDEAEYKADIAKIPQAYGGAQPSLSPRLKLVTDLAQAEADRLKDEYVSTEHLLVAIASEFVVASSALRLPAVRLLTLSVVPSC